MKVTFILNGSAIIYLDSLMSSKRVTVQSIIGTLPFSEECERFV